MDDNQESQSIEKVKNELYEQIIKDILDYIRNNDFPNNNPDSYMNAYTKVRNTSDKGDEQNEYLFNYHNSLIEGFIKDCYEIISKESSNQLNFLKIFPFII